LQFTASKIKDFISEQVPKIASVVSKTLDSGYYVFTRSGGSKWRYTRPSIERYEPHLNVTISSTGKTSTHFLFVIIFSHRYIRRSLAMD
jgi:hypothetical protein